MKRYPYGFSAGALTLVLVTASATVEAQAAPDEQNEAVNCALIRDGIQRLACYDAQNDPIAARKTADEDTLQQADEEAAIPVADDARREQIVSDALEDDSGTGLVAALVDSYLTAEKAIFSFSGSFVTHRPNYILPITYVDDPNPRPISPRLGPAGYDFALEEEEAKYQISFKIPLLTGIFDDRTTDLLVWLYPAVLLAGVQHQRLRSLP